jgi:glycosyltransferase involved in cell wall biosynthesis
MQIAQIAPLTEAIPPKLYGGTERVISWLTNELVALGHEVDLFASGEFANFGPAGTMLSPTPTEPAPKDPVRIPEKVPQSC